VIILFLVNIILLACTNEVLSAQHLCEAVATNDMKKVEHQIKNYITGHQKAMNAAIMECKPLTDWLAAHACVRDVIPPEAIRDILPATYSVYINFITRSGERMMNLTLQQDTKLSFLSLTDAPDAIGQFKTFSAEMIKAVFVSKGKQQPNRSFSFTDRQYLDFYKEELTNSQVRVLFMQLDSSHTGARRLQPIHELRKAGALYHLLALQQHPSYDVKITAIDEIREMKDMRATPLLLNAATQNAFDVQGSEEATLHKIYQQKIIEILDALTQSQTPYMKGNETEALKKGVMVWSKKQ